MTKTPLVYAPMPTTLLCHSIPVSPLFQELTDFMSLVHSSGSHLSQRYSINLITRTELSNPHYSRALAIWVQISALRVTLWISLASSLSCLQLSTSTYFMGSLRV